MKSLEELIKLLRLDTAYQWRPRIICSDGFSISVQANWGAYCSPRNNIGPYYEVELGFPSDFDEILLPYSENLSELSDMRETVFPYVPISVLYESLKTHGDFELASDNFANLEESVKHFNLQNFWA